MSRANSKRDRARRQNRRQNRSQSRSQTHSKSSLPVTSQRGQSQNPLYLAYIFLTGAVTLSMELLASRILTPYFGVSLFIWSGILSITLIALSLGYFAGGRATQTPSLERRFSLDFLFLLMPTVSGIAIAGSCLLYPKIFHILGSASLVMGAYVACMILIFFPLVAVSSMNPLLIAIQDEQRNRGEESGDHGSGLVFFVSTVGSVIGVSLTAFLFIPNVTNFNSMLILGFTLSTISLVGGFTSDGLRSEEAKLLLRISAVGVAISLGLLAFSSTYLEKNEPVISGRDSWNLEREYTSLFGNTKIVTIAPIEGTPEAAEIETYGTLYYNDGITMNIVDAAGQSLTPFTYGLEFLSLGLRPNAESALMLGLGAGIVPMWLADKGLAVDVVEINPSSIEAAQDYFGFDSSRVSVVQTDARTYVRRCEKSYDIVLIDMSNGDGLPEYLLSLEFFKDVRHCLTADGIAVFNTFAATKHMAAYYHIVRTIKAVFPDLLMYHDGLEDGKPAVSIYLAALQQPSDGRFEIPIEIVPSSLAPTIAKVFQAPRPIDAALLAKAEVLEDEFNRFSFLNIASDQFFRESILITVPPAFLTN